MTRYFDTVTGILYKISTLVVWVLSVLGIASALVITADWTNQPILFSLAYLFVTLAIWNKIYLAYRDLQYTKKIQEEAENEGVREVQEVKQ